MNDLSVCGEACNCVKCRAAKVPVEPPKYMFEGETTHGGTWLILSDNDKLRVYDISIHVAMLVDPDTGDYCYVYWDEADQCSNPYPSYKDAANAFERYMQHLIGDALSQADEMNDNMRKYGTIDKPTDI
jgi:hypothetical protein